MKIPFNAPWLTDLERRYLLEAYDSGWLTTGAFVERFEAGFRSLTGRREAVACTSGTAALWLALKALELPTGQRVAVPAFTCDAVAHAVTLATGQPPFFVDVESETFGMSGRELSVFPVGSLGAVILVHIYGVPARDTATIYRWCQERGVVLIEDGSEAHGARHADGVPVGSVGAISVFSCRGEKIVGAGQLGVCVTDDAGLAARMRSYAENGLVSPSLRYWSVRPGLNLRPANPVAAIGVAQLERLDELVARRCEVHRGWRKALDGMPVTFQEESGSPSWWLTAIRLQSRLDPRDAALALSAEGIETRPGFYPLHWLPCYVNAPTPRSCPDAERLFRTLLLLPSSPHLTEDEQRWVAERLGRVLGR